MAIMLKDGAILLNDGKIALDPACCCNQCNKCSFVCANSAELAMTGWQDYTCPEATFGIPAYTYNYSYFYGTELNKTFSTSDITKGCSAIPCFHCLTLDAAFNLGAYGTGDRGLLIAEEIISDPGVFTQTTQTYVWKIEAGINCAPVVTGFDGGLCRTLFFAGFTFAGTVRLYTHRFVNNVFSAFGNSPTTSIYAYKGSGSVFGTTCLEVPDLVDDIAPSDACNIAVEADAISPGEAPGGCPGPGAPSFYALQDSGTSIFTAVG